MIVLLLIVFMSIILLEVPDLIKKKCGVSWWLFHFIFQQALL